MRKVIAALQTSVNDYNEGSDKELDWMMADILIEHWNHDHPTPLDNGN